MKKSFIVLVVAFVLSVASSAWGIYLDIYSYQAKVGVQNNHVATIQVEGWESFNLLTMKINYSITGALPPGLRLDQTGNWTYASIGGTPTKAGVYDFTVIATVRDTKNPLVYDYASSPCTITVIDPSADVKQDTVNDDDEEKTEEPETPKIIEKPGTDSDDDNNKKKDESDPGSSGGGCDLGVGIIGLMLLGAGLVRKFK